MTPTLLAYGALALAIILEVSGTSLLKETEGFTRPLPTLAMVLCYVGAFYCLTITIRTVPVGIAYAIWAGAGVVLVALVGVFIFKQPLDWPARIGVGFIVTGVVVMNVFSNSVRH